MACFHPLDAFRALGNAGGPIRFGKAPLGAYKSFQLPCGQCVGCRLERSRQWAVRCMHEAKLHDRNCFITLTYDDAHLPDGMTLVLKDFQQFMKRLRKHHGSGIRFFHCGEYGDKYSRPHYHACLFNFDFSDKLLFRTTPQGNNLYISDKLNKLWPFGFATIGDVTFESAAYVARYVMKKRTGEMAKEHYRYVDPDGVVTDRLPEYTTMSRRPGIGAGFAQRFLADIYPDDFVLVNGKKARPPRFYDGIYEQVSAHEFEQLKISRVRNAKRHAENNTPDRLKVREAVQEAKLERLTRDGVD